MSMTHTHYDPWQQAADNVRGCEGARLKCSGRTGSWTLDGTAVSVDPGGLMITVIMPTALHGYILFEQNTVTGRRAASYENIAPGDEKPGLGWEPLTEFLCTGADQKHRGQLMTFQAASWGGRHAFEKLINPYLRRGQLEFPTCELSTRDRGDANGTIDPVFTPKGWVARAAFSHLLPTPEPRPALEGERPVAPRPVITSGRPKTLASSDMAPPPIDTIDDSYADRGPIDDDIPF